jgi:hypothetical protein
VAEFGAESRALFLHVSAPMEWTIRILAFSMIVFSPSAIFAQGQPPPTSERHSSTSEQKNTLNGVRNDHERNRPIAPPRDPLFEDVKKNPQAYDSTAGGNAGVVFEKNGKLYWASGPGENAHSQLNVFFDKGVRTGAWIGMPDWLPKVTAPGEPSKPTPSKGQLLAREIYKKLGFKACERFDSWPERGLGLYEDIRSSPEAYAACVQGANKSQRDLTDCDYEMLRWCGGTGGRSRLYSGSKTRNPFGEFEYRPKPTYERFLDSNTGKWEYRAVYK